MTPVFVLSLSDVVGLTVLGLIAIGFLLLWIGSKVERLWRRWRARSDEKFWRSAVDKPKAKR